MNQHYYLLAPFTSLLLLWLYAAALLSGERRLEVAASPGGMRTSRTDDREAIVEDKETAQRRLLKEKPPLASYLWPSLEENSEDLSTASRV